MPSSPNCPRMELMLPVTTGLEAGPATCRLPCHSLSSPLPRTKNRFGMLMPTFRCGPAPEDDEAGASCPASTTFRVGMFVPNELTI